MTCGLSARLPPSIVYSAMPTLRLVSTSGDQTFELKDGRTLVVGRGLTSDIAIYDPTISRRHAELDRRR